MTDQNDSTASHSQIRQMQRAIDRQSADADILRDLIQISTQTISELKEALSLGHEQLRESRRHHLHLQHANTTLQTQLDALHKEHEAVCEKFRVNLLGEQSRSKAVVEKAAVEKAAMEQKYALALKTGKAAQSELEQAQKVAADALGEHLKLEQTLETCQTLETENAALAQANTKLQETVAIHQSELEQARKTAADALSEHLKLEQTLETCQTLETENAALAQANTKLQETVAIHQSELEQARKTADDALEAQLRLEDKIKQKDTDIAVLGNEIEQMSTEVAHLKSSNEMLATTRQAEVAELGALLSDKDHNVAQLSVLQIRQRIADILRKPHAWLQRDLASRNPLATARRHAQARVTEEINLITASELFDPVWYKTTYPDIGNQDPARHFVENGTYELRNPSAGFDTLKYHLANPDVTERGLPALVHYLRYGKSDGRKIQPVD